VTECTATAGRLGLGPLGLEGDALGSSALLARDLGLGLGRRRVRAETARGIFDRLDSGDGRDFLVDGSCSRRRQLEKLAERRGPCWRMHVCARTRLPSNYPLGDCSRSQVFVDEGERASASRALTTVLS